MKAWDQFLQDLEAELGAKTVQKWLKTLKVQKFDACNLYLEAKDSFQAQWFEEHIHKKVQTHLKNGNNKKIKVHLSTANATSPKKPNAKFKKRDETHSFKLTAFDELTPHCSFEHFVVNEENALAYKLLSEVTGLASDNHQGFNPIYLYGKEGSGKTHLLMSVANALKAKGLNIIYARADTFTDHVVSAIRAGEMGIFRQAYRNIDVLIVDDVHVFSRKGATQEEFFHTFNTLHVEGKQIILSANCAPQELHLIEPRLVSRFEWGIVLPIKTLKSQELLQVLKTKAKNLNFNLPENIAHFLNETFVSSPKALIRALEALILRLHLDASNPHSTLSLPAVRSILADLLIDEQKSTLTPSKIIQAVAEQYGIPSEDILGKAQTRDCSVPRQMAMYLCRKELQIPFMKIGDLFSRDHSTVISGIKQIQKAIDQSEPDMTDTYYAVMKKLK